jgi:hypothetical protein
LENFSLVYYHWLDVILLFNNNIIRINSSNTAFFMMFLSQ